MGTRSSGGAYVRDSLIETAISKDVLLLNPVEKPALLRNLFVLSCEYGGQVLSYQKMVGRLTDVGNTTTLARYQKLLESASLVVGLEKFSGSKIRQRGSSPKWLPLDTALMTALDQRSLHDTRRDATLWGRLVECAVGAHLFRGAVPFGFRLFYWRERNRDVDYVLQKGKDLVAIEVKTGARKTNLSGLAEFAKRYKPFSSLVVGTSGIPVEEFLSSRVDSLFG